MVYLNFLAPIQNSIDQLDLILKTDHSIPEIPNLLNKTVLLGGKKLRPALCFLMGQALGVPQDKMAHFARASEFTHAASLAHDDVVDNASTRRLQRTINAESSNKKAVLAGDLLLARVMVELSQQGDVQIIKDLSLVVEDLVNGEWLQMSLRGRSDTQYEELVEVSKRKTASLMSWCCKVAARLSPYSSGDVIQLASDFGENLGVAFQMMDDVIDFSSMSEKDYAKDIKEGLVNYVMSDLLKRKPELRSDVQTILGKADTQDWPWNEKDLMVSVENVRVNALSYLTKAHHNLLSLKKILQPSVGPALESFTSLEGLIAYMSMRQL